MSLELMPFMRMAHKGKANLKVGRTETNWASVAHGLSPPTPTFAKMHSTVWIGSAMNSGSKTAMKKRKAIIANVSAIIISGEDNGMWS
jgi:hypothetical protein